MHVYCSYYIYFAWRKKLLFKYKCVIKFRQVIILSVFNSADQQFSYKCQEPRCYVFIDTAVISAPRCCNDLAFARHVSKAAVLGSEVHTVWSSRAGQGEMLQKCDHEEEYLHASQGLSNTSSLSWEQRHQLCQGLELQQTKPQKRANLWALA